MFDRQLHFGELKSRSRLFYNALPMSNVRAESPSLQGGFDEPHPDRSVLSGYFQYETLEFAGRLELLDREDHVARFIRRQRIRFLEDGVSVFYDRVWGDGILFAGYFAQGLRMLQPIRTRKGYVLPLALPRPFRKGETFEVRTERRIIGGFTHREVHWDLAMAVPTELLTLDVNGPHSHFGRPMVVAPPHSHIDADVSHGSLRLRVRYPTVEVPYTLGWSRK